MHCRVCSNSGAELCATPGCFCVSFVCVCVCVVPGITAVSALSRSLSGLLCGRHCNQVHCHFTSTAVLLVMLLRVFSQQASRRVSVAPLRACMLSTVGQAELLHIPLQARTALTAVLQDG